MATSAKYIDFNHIANRRLVNIEKQAAVKKSSTPGHQYDQFRVSPTVPPSTAVIIRPGMVYTDVGTWFYLDMDGNIPQNTADFGNPTTSEMEVAVNFSTSGAFVGLVFGYDYEYLSTREPIGLGYTYKYIIRGGVTEFATALEAETYITDNLYNGGESFQYQYGLPLWALVLKNNGTTGVDGAVLPIDAINRGRSYLFRDVRPRYYLVA